MTKKAGAFTQGSSGSKKCGQVSIEEIKRAATGRVIDLLVDLVGIPREYLDGRHHPCIKCGGKDRFRLVDDGAGALLCNQCFKTGNGDFLNAIQHFLGVSRNESYQMAADYLGIGGSAKGCASRKTANEKERSPKVASCAKSECEPEFATLGEAEACVIGEYGQPVNRWEYCRRGTNELRGVMLRYPKRGGGKFFVPVSLQPSGKWAKGGMVKPWPLLYENEIGDASLVVITEGEGKAELVRSLGFTAVTSPHGALSAKYADWSALAGKQAVILPDNNANGRVYVASVCDAVGSLGNTPPVKVAEFKGIAEDEDVADWVKQQGAVGGVEIARRLQEIIDNARPMAPAKEKPKRRPVLQQLDQVECVKTNWLWENRIPLGGITSLVGYGGEGKSFITCAVGTNVTNGWSFVDGSPCPKGRVVILPGEDSPSRLNERFKANGADLSKISILSGFVDESIGEEEEFMLSLADIDMIRESVEMLDDVKLLIIDPIGDYIPGVDSNKDNEVRSLLTPLARLAAERQFAVLMVCHRKKGSGERADNTAVGSVAFINKARAAHYVMMDPDDKRPKEQRRRIFAAGKINDAMPASTLAFYIRPPDGLIEWEKEPLDVTADDVMQRANELLKGERGPEAEDRREAEEWLAKALENGPRPAGDLFREANEEGIVKRTLQRARKKIGVQWTKEGFGSGSAVSWFMPVNQPALEPAEESELEESFSL